MVRLGRVYCGLMIDLQAANAKLSRRKNDILGHLTGHDEPEVQDALATAGGDIKIAVLLLNGCEIEEARKLLQRTAGELRSAMKMLAQRGQGKLGR
jgi:N-acetylmuramic acid 6-phosphate etherase